ALGSTAVAYFAHHPGQYTFYGPADAPFAVSTSLELAAGYLQEVAAQWSSLKSNYQATGVGTTPPATTVATPNLIRTGTGSISIAAAGSIDLRNGAQPTYVDPDTGAVTTSASGYQLGGAAVYTAGAPVKPVAVTAVDPTTGLSVTLDPTDFATVGRNVGVL